MHLKLVSVFGIIGSHLTSTTLWTHDVIATLNQRQRSWFSVASESCAQGTAHHPKNNISWSYFGPTLKQHQIDCRLFSGIFGYVHLICEDRRVRFSADLVYRGSVWHVIRLAKSNRYVTWFTPVSPEISSYENEADVQSEAGPCADLYRESCHIS